MELCKNRRSVCECVTEHSPVLVCDYHLRAAVKKSGKDSTKLAETEKEGSVELSLCLIAVGALIVLLPCMIRHCSKKKKQ